MAIQPTERQHHTIDDLLAMPDDGKRYELIDGEIVEMGTSSLKHSVLGNAIARLIGNYVELKNLGGFVSGPDGTYQIDNKNVRVPDISYLSAEGIAKLLPGTVFVQFAPDFVIEIKSPSQNAAAMRRLAQDYLQAGTRLVWIVNYEDESILVYHPGQLPVQLSGEDILSGEDVLPGFTIKPSDMFAKIAGIP